MKVTNSTQIHYWTSIQCRKKKHRSSVLVLKVLVLCAVQKTPKDECSREMERGKSGEVAVHILRVRQGGWYWNWPTVLY